MTPQRSAFITGASRGIGHGIAAHLAAQGWDLTLVARGPDRLHEVREALLAAGAGQVEVAAADMADPDQIEAAATIHREAFRSMHALIFGAGVGSAAPLANYPMRRFDKQLAVNTRAPFQLIGSCLDLLRTGALDDPAHGARVIALSSLAGVYPETGLSAYSASKAALISLVQAINLEEGAAGVTATAISPGYVDTDMSDWISDRIPKDTMITINDVVRVVDLILSVSATTALPQIVMNRPGHTFTA